MRETEHSLQDCTRLRPITVEEMDASVGTSQISNGITAVVPRNGAAPKLDLQYVLCNYFAFPNSDTDFVNTAIKFGFIEVSLMCLNN